MNSVFAAMADMIVNPRCDECGVSVRPANPAIGPHLCGRCSSSVMREGANKFREWKGRGRSIHVVKLPDEMQ